MLRPLDEHGSGIMKHTKCLLEESFKTYRQHQYILLYKTSTNTGKFGRLGNVHERTLDAASKPTWDQASGTHRIADDESLAVRITEIGKICRVLFTWEECAASALHFLEGIGNAQAS
jgi:hypothetical protein